MKSEVRAACWVVALLVLLATVSLAQGVTPESLKALRWRSLGPTVFGGRVADVAGVPGNPNIFYVAHSSAGLFKTTNGGTTFESIFDQAGTLSIGAIALSPTNPEVVYVGTGEGKPRNSASFGDGIYRSSDGGRTWKHLGLKDTERFSRIVVNPLDPQVIFAAAMGHEWGANQERGVFRSSDGGATWKRVLFTNATSGASDVAIDTRNPNIVYAGLYDYQRKPWHFRSGGPGSGLFRSTDGGETWTRLTDPKLKNGLPEGLIGRIGLAIAQSTPNVVYAMIESQEKGKLWRSDDRGDTWRMVSADPAINIRAFYFTVVRVDPQNENRVYAVSGGLQVSEDGGRTFRAVRKARGDNHALWIDPRNPARILSGSDGGFELSNDRGATWDFVNTLPFAQTYHVGFDMDEPYHVLAGFQDNELWYAPSERRATRGTANGDWRRLVPWGDGMYAIADPRDANVVYVSAHWGDLSRIDLRTGERRFINPYPVISFGSAAKDSQYRFNWNAPLAMSPANPDVLYFGSNVLFRTTDAGQTWKAISPDLTTNDPEKMQISGDPLSPDMTHAEDHCTITSISESARDQKVIWAGTDDGNLQVTRDAGRTWTNVIGNIKDLKPNSWVTTVQASRHQAGTAYVSFDRHQLDDFAPYAYLTTDYGKTWTRISQGLRGYVHVIRDDPREPNLLYAGTELGVFASFDKGKTWTDLRLGLPPLPVRDLDVHPRDNDLVIGTHARGIYVLDDVTALQQLAHETKPVALFTPMPATRFIPVPDTAATGDRAFVARNKPFGAMISYFLASPREGERVELEIVDAAGKHVRALRGTTQPGVNRVVWDLREEGGSPREPGAARNQDEGGYLWFGVGPRAPLVLPGEYRVRLTVQRQTLEKPLTVRLDPRSHATPDQLRAQHNTLIRLLQMQKRVSAALAQIRSVGDQLTTVAKVLPDRTLAEQATAITKDLQVLAGRLRNDQGEYRAAARVRENIAQLYVMVSQYDGPPTQVQAEWIDKFDKQSAEIIADLKKVLDERLASFNASLRNVGVSATVSTGN